MGRSVQLGSLGNGSAARAGAPSSQAAAAPVSAEVWRNALREMECLVSSADMIGSYCLEPVGNENLRSFGLEEEDSMSVPRRRFASDWKAAILNWLRPLLPPSSDAS